MLCHPYDTFTFKTKVLYHVDNAYTTCIIAFAAILMTSRALPFGFNWGAFCYLGHAHALYGRQGPCSFFSNLQRIRQLLLQY